VATVLGIPLDEGLRLVGKKGCTSARDLRVGLAKKGVVLGDRHREQTSHPYHIVRVHWGKKPEPPRKSKVTHWVVHVSLPDGSWWVWDPTFGRLTELIEGSYITSWYPLVGFRDVDPTTA